MNKSCIVCGQPVVGFSWWTKDPEKYPDAQPIHEGECWSIYFGENTMNCIGVMIGTYLFETIQEAHKALEIYGMINGTCETFLVKIPETPYNNLLKRTREQYPV